MHVGHGHDQPLDSMCLIMPRSLFPAIEMDVQPVLVHDINRQTAQTQQPQRPPEHRSKHRLSPLTHLFLGANQQGKNPLAPAQHLLS